MALRVNGVDLATAYQNVTTLSGQLSGAGRRGNNQPVGDSDGAAWLPDKPLDELVFTLTAWITAAGGDGSVSGALLVRERLRILRRLFGDGSALVELEDPDTDQRCFVEVTMPVNPRTMAGGTRLEVELEVRVPAGCWEDVDQVTNTAVLTNSGGMNLSNFAGGDLPLADLELVITGPATNLRVATPNGSWLQWSGAIPAALTIITGPRWAAYATGTPGTSLLGSLTWGPAGRFTVPIPAIGSPSISWTATGTSGASELEVRGRRRYQSA